MSKSTLNIFLVLSLLIVSFNCNLLDSEQMVSEKILITDEFGNVRGGNLNDWCSRANSNSYGGFRFGAAYPNPCDPNTTIGFDLPTDCFVLIYFDYDKVVFAGERAAGSYEIKIDKSTFGFENEVVRIYMRTSTGFACSGYIQFGTL